MSVFLVGLCRTLGMTRLAAKLGGRSATVPDQISIPLPADLGGRRRLRGYGPLQSVWD